LNACVQELCAHLVERGELPEAIKVKREHGPLQVGMLFVWSDAARGYVVPGFPYLIPADDARKFFGILFEAAPMQLEIYYG